MASALSYFPATYQNGYAPQYPIFQQPQVNYSVPQQQQQPVQQPTQQNPANILWVRNEQEAAMYPVAPNNAVPLWDSNSPVLYLKQADASGKPTMKIYDLIERKTPEETASGESGKNIAYATKEELAALAGVVKDVDGVIAGLRDDVNALKEPKKAKKKESDE